MNKLCLATLALCLVAASAADSNPKTPTGPALIAQVCKNMANKDLCSSMLTEDPGTKNADLTRLTLISIRLTSFSAIDTWGVAYARQRDDMDPAAKCYSDCAKSYNDAVDKLDESFAPLVAKKYADVKKIIETAMNFGDACEVCFKTGKHEKNMIGRDVMFRNQCTVAVSLVDALQMAGQ